MYSAPEADARKPYAVPCEKWPRVGASLVLSAAGGPFEVLGMRGLVGIFGKLLLETSLGTGGRGGGPSIKCHRFFPIAQTSSQELPPTFIPCVLQSQAMSQARKVIPSTKDA